MLSFLKTISVGDLLQVAILRREVAVLKEQNQDMLRYQREAIDTQTATILAAISSSGGGGKRTKTETTANKSTAFESCHVKLYQEVCQLRLEFSLYLQYK